MGRINHIISLLRCPVLVILYATVVDLAACREPSYYILASHAGIGKPLVAEAHSFQTAIPGVGRTDPGVLLTFNGNGARTDEHTPNFFPTWPAAV